MEKLILTMPTVLIVAASPLDQDRLRLGAEVRDIRHALQRSRNREHWKIESNEAATVDDLRQALLDLRPSVLHFSGHGGDEGCALKTQMGIHIALMPSHSQNFSTTLRTISSASCSIHAIPRSRAKLFVRRLIMSSECVQRWTMTQPADSQ